MRQSYEVAWRALVTRRLYIENVKLNSPLPAVDVSGKGIGSGIHRIVAGIHGVFDGSLLGSGIIGAPEAMTNRSHIVHVSPHPITNQVA